MNDRAEVGATGAYPPLGHGPGDRGELRAALSVDREKGILRLEFGTSLSWLSMTPAQAVAFATELLAGAAELTGGGPGQ